MIELTEREYAILRLLSSGRTYAWLAEYGKMTPECVHTHCYHIRQKTGIRDTQNKAECRAVFNALNGRSAIPSHIGPTPTQVAIMRYFVTGMDIAQIARQQGMGNQTALNHLSIGCRRAKIGGTGRYEYRRPEIKAWLDEHDGIGTMRDPMFQ